MFNYDRMNEQIEKCGKTKVFLCKQLGKGKTYLRDAEKQKTNISGETLDILAEELDTTPAYLTDETDDPAPGTKKDLPQMGEVDAQTKKIFNFIDTGSAGELQEVSDFIDFIISKRAKNNGAEA